MKIIVFHLLENFFILTKYKFFLVIVVFAQFGVPQEDSALHNLLKKKEKKSKEYLTQPRNAFYILNFVFVQI